ncbi:hypothetical protein ACIGHB_32910 [Streptomyces sp. NPDC085460]|uniref:hypothetical protein n=1 Tax=Streptomyces sp. NPDC085460 TaxID=3365723 RepID=UPI0037CEEC51
MTHNFGLHLALELGNRFGSPTDSWPPSAEPVTPFLAIVVNALGTQEAVRWFDAARRAHQSVVAADEARTHQFGFPSCLDGELGLDRAPSLAVVAAWEAMKALYVVARRDATLDVDVLFECALRACSRSGGLPAGSPIAAAATA